MYDNERKSIIGPIIICIAVLVIGFVPIIIMNRPSKNEEQLLVWASYGDSITYLGGWQEMTAEKFGSGGILHHKLGIRGTTITNGVRDNASRPAMSYTVRLNGLMEINPDIVTIFGGMNDITYMSPIGTEGELSKPLTEKNVNTFIGGYSYIIETLRAWKPSLAIVIIVTYDRFIDDTDIEQQESIQNATRAVVDYYNLPYIDGDAEFPPTDRETYILDDGQHLTDTGKSKLAGLLTAKFNTIMG
jgi:lysophospholipase L1-like esterase